MRAPREVCQVPAGEVLQRPHRLGTVSEAAIAAELYSQVKRQTTALGDIKPWLIKAKLRTTERELNAKKSELKTIRMILFFTFN